MTSRPPMRAGATVAGITAAVILLCDLVVVATRAGTTPVRTFSESAPWVALVTTTTTTTTLPPTTTPPTVTVPRPSFVTPSTLAPRRAKHVVALPIRFARFPPPTTTTAVPPSAAIAPGSVGSATFTAAGLGRDAYGCHYGVCISVDSQGGRGPLIIQWDATSSTAGPCAQFRYLYANVVIGESRSLCAGAGIYSTTWAPDQSEFAS